MALLPFNPQEEQSVALGPEGNVLPVEGPGLYGQWAALGASGRSVYWEPWLPPLLNPCIRITGRQLRIEDGMDQSLHRDEMSMNSV